MGLVKYNRDGSDFGDVSKGHWIYKDSEGQGPSSQTKWFNIPEIPTGGGVLVTSGINSYTFTDSNTVTNLLNVGSRIDNRNYKRNSARGEWVAMDSGTIEYITPFPSTEIMFNGGSPYTTPNIPNSGTITVTAGQIITADKPIVLTDSDGGHRMVPVNLKADSFANYSNRYGNSNFYIYNPNPGEITVLIYQGVGGTSSSPIDSIAVPANSVATYTGTEDTGWYWFHCERADFCMSVTEDSGDRHVMAPAGNYIYTRRSSYDITMGGTAPTSQGTYHNYDANYKCVSVEIADGSGGDSCQHLALENLSNTYAYGNSLSDYHITMPFDGSVTVYYADGDTNNGWKELNNHTFNGSLLSPGQIGIDGDSDPGSFDDSGSAPYLAGGAIKWLFKGTKPFKLTINDTSNDEETLFGWMEQENSINFSSESDLRSYIDTRDDWMIIESAE